MEISITFYIQVYVDGYQIPLMHLESSPLKTIKELSHLARGHLSNSDGVRSELENMQSVLHGIIEVHSFGGDEWCIVDFRKEKSTIINFFDEFEPFEIESKFIFKLMEDWYAFLLKWENNEIPGLIHPESRRTKEL